jgi:tetratricopeptide (TPR) repeat protein
MVGVFNSGRSRFDKAEVAYARALNLQPDMAHVYYNRALNQARWGIAEAEAGQRGSAGEHLRQARLFAITSHALGDSTAKRLLDNIEEALRHYGVTD